jgi:hypothetical protein
VAAEAFELVEGCHGRPRPQVSPVDPGQTAQALHIVPRLDFRARHVVPVGQWPLVDRRLGLGEGCAPSPWDTRVSAGCLWCP